MWTNVQGLCVFTDDLEMNYFLNVRSSWTRLSFSVEEWDPNSMVLNFLAGQRIPWMLKKALDLLPRKVCRSLPAQFAWGSPWSSLLESDVQPFFPTGSLEGWDYHIQCSSNWGSLGKGSGPHGGPLEHWGCTAHVPKAKPPLPPLHPPPCTKNLWPGNPGTWGQNSQLNRGPSIGVQLTVDLMIL